jgi:hypothetical protein
LIITTDGELFSCGKVKNDENEIFLFNSVTPIKIDFFKSVFKNIFTSRFKPIFMPISFKNEIIIWGDEENIWGNMFYFKEPIPVQFFCYGQKSDSDVCGSNGNCVLKN